MDLTPASATLTLFGRRTLRVERVAEPVRITSRRAWALLAYLAMQPGRAASREQITALLWGDRFDVQARHSLRQCLLVLRQELGAAGEHLLIAERDEIRLASQGLAIDVQEFLTLAQSAEPADLERAASLYSGPFLADLDLEIEAFEHWLGSQRARIGTAAADFLQRWIAHCDRHGRGADAVAACERLIELDPLRQDWQRVVLPVVARHQGREVANRRAQEFIARLKREHAAEPEPATSALIEEIAAASTAARPDFDVAPAALPISPDAPASAAMAPARQPAASAAGMPPQRAGRPAWALAAAALIGLIGAGSIGALLLARSSTPAPDASPQPAALHSTPPAAGALRSGFKHCDVCPEMVELPEGYFQMGSPPNDAHRHPNETPQRTVRFAAPFAIGKFEVTIEQFAAFVDASGYRPPDRCMMYAMDLDQWLAKAGSFREPSYPVTGAHPASCVSWNDAKAYVAWLGAKTGKPYRLASEAEWEYAARAGTTTPYSFGDDHQPSPCLYAKLADASTRFSWRLTTCNSHAGHGAAPVGRHRPNAWGLHDMHGNVWEWVEDCWHPSYVDAPVDGSAWLAGQQGDCARRVVRGGSWRNTLPAIRSAQRLHFPTASVTDVRGFRVALSPAR
jgi:formylglycine-generating enzyme required for sulfatase activity